MTSVVRICRLCDTAQPITNFYGHGTRLRNECKPCYRKMRRGWKNGDGPTRAARKREIRLRRNAQIVAVYAEGGYTYRELGDRFGLSYEGVRRIVEAEENGLSIEPLRRMVHNWCARDNTMQDLGRLLAYGRDGNVPNAQRWLHRVLSAQAHFVPWAAADEICIAMGLHPFQVYGEEWWAA